MGIREEAFQPIEGKGYPLTSTEFKLELEFPDDVPMKVLRWLVEYAIEKLGPRQHVLGVSLLVRYKVERSGF